MLGWGSYCQRCIHYCLLPVPSHQYHPEKIWYGGTFHWQSMPGWVDSVLIWDNGARHELLAPLGHIGVFSMLRGCMNGLEIHWGGVCFLCMCEQWPVCACVSALFSTPEVPITDYPTKDRKNKEEKNCLLLTMLRSAREHQSERMQQGKCPVCSWLVDLATFSL